MKKGNFAEIAMQKKDDDKNEFYELLAVNTPLCLDTVEIVQEYLGIPQFLWQKVENPGSVALIIEWKRKPALSLHGFKQSLIKIFVNWQDVILTIFKMPSKKIEEEYSEIYFFRFHENPNIFFGQWSAIDHKLNCCPSPQLKSRFFVLMDKWLPNINLISINELEKPDDTRYFIGLLGGHGYATQHEYSLDVNNNGGVQVQGTNISFSLREANTWAELKLHHNCQIGPGAYGFEKFCRCKLCRHGCHDMCGNNCEFKNKMNLLIYKLTVRDISTVN